MMGNILRIGVIIIVSFLDMSPAAARPSDDEIITKLSPKVEALDRSDLITLGKAYSRKKNPTAAAKVFNAALALDGTDREAKTLLAGSLIASGRDSEGLNALKEIIEANPKYIPAYRVLIKMYGDRNNKYELRLLYQDMHDRIGPRTEYITKLCELYTAEGLFDLGQRYCEQGTQKDASIASNFVYLGIVYRDTGKTKKAEDLLKKAAEDFSQSYLAQITYAQFLDYQKNFVASFSYWRAATLISAKDSLAFLGLAKSALEIQKYQDSMDAFISACKIDRATLPDFRRATNLLRTSKNPEWTQKFEKASETCDKK